MNLIDDVLFCFLLTNTAVQVLMNSLDSKHFIRFWNLRDRLCASFVILLNESWNCSVAFKQFPWWLMHQLAPWLVITRAYRWEESYKATKWPRSSFGYLSLSTRWDQWILLVILKHDFFVLLQDQIRVAVTLICVLVYYNGVLLFEFSWAHYPISYLSDSGLRAKKLFVFKNFKFEWRKLLLAWLVKH